MRDVATKLHYSKLGWGQRLGARQGRGWRLEVGGKKEESGIRKEELGKGRMEIGIGKEETAKWKQDRENRNEELGNGRMEIGIGKEETAEKEREGREWDFLWKARMNRMIRMVGWKQLNVEKEEIKEGLKNELFELAIDDFRLNLEKFRKLYPVKTICMHGSPLSKWDNRDLWKRYSYRDFGIIAEPYFDVDYGEVLYLTDTGRRWDGDEVSVRDKVTQERGKRKEESVNGKMEIGNGKRELGIRKKTMNEKLGLKLRYTWDIIEAAERGLLPDKIMLNVHPQRWDDRFGLWVKELVWQNVKNLIKKWMIRVNSFGKDGCLRLDD